MLIDFNNEEGEKWRNDAHHTLKVLNGTLREDKEVDYRRILFDPQKVIRRDDHRDSRPPLSARAPPRSRHVAPQRRRRRGRSAAARRPSTRSARARSL